MKQNPLVSIAMCTYNGEKYLIQQLESIQNQSHKNLEIIIVDDCSTDGTVEILNKFVHLDRRIKIFKNPVNIGYNKNFEKAVQLTSGEFIAISDQDDVWMSDKIESLLAKIADNWLIFSNSTYINSKSELLEGRILKRIDESTLTYKGLLLRNFVTGHTVLFDRKLLNYILPIPNEGFYDWWMGFVALYHNKIIYCNKTLTQYRIHDNSVIQKALNSGGTGRNENKTILTMLTCFEAYKNLESDSRKFIGNLKKALILSTSKLDPFPFINMVLKNYGELFPTKKKKNAIILIIFAIRYSKRMQTRL